MIYIPRSCLKMCRILNNAGAETYLVGGTVRDYILKTIYPEKEITIGDIDIATNMLPDKIHEVLTSHGYSTTSVGIQFGTIVVHTENGDFEVTTYRIEGNYEEEGRNPIISEIKFTNKIIEDLARRDFTMNAIAIDTRSLNEINHNKDMKNIIIIDPYGGMNDLKEGIIQTVGNPNNRFSEDPLRMFRLARFAAKLELIPTWNTIQAVKDNAFLIKDVSNERIKMELDKMLTAKQPDIGFFILRLSGLLTIILPELYNLMKITQEGTPHIHNAYVHSLRTLEAINTDKIKQILKDCQYILPSLRLAALFHDLGKAKTKTLKKGKAQFIGHEKESVKITGKIMRRLKSSNKQRDFVKDIVGHHMLFCDPNTHSTKIFRRLINKFAVQHGDENTEAMTRAIIAIRYADIKGADGTESPDIDNLSNMLDTVIKEFGTKKVQLCVNGHTIEDWISPIEHPSEIGIAIKYLLDKIIDNPNLNNTFNLKKLLNERI